MELFLLEKVQKGIKNKNFVKINNKKRLIDYTFAEAEKSKLLTKIALTTDDNRIIKHSKKYNIDYVIKREKIFNRLC